MNGETARLKSGVRSTERDLLQQRLGQLVLAMLRRQRHLDRPIRDLTQLALDPLLADRVAFASGEGEQEDLQAIALWASVNDVVHDQIAAAAAAGHWPELAREDWRGGDNVWLLDILARDRSAATSVFMSFTKLTGGRSFRLHPFAFSALDPALIERFKEALSKASAGTEVGAETGAETAPETP